VHFAHGRHVRANDIWVARDGKVYRVYTVGAAERDDVLAPKMIEAI